MDKLEKVIKGFNIRHMLDSFFNKYIKKHFNEAHSEDYIESDLGDNISATAKYIKILGGQHIETFLRSLISNNVGTDASYNNLVVQVIKDDNLYEGVVEKTDVNSSSIVLRPFEAFGVAIEMPAKVRLFTNPILTSDAKSSIIYNSVVAGESKYNLILGERNIHKGKDNVKIFGKNNVSRENNHNSLINGYNNTVNSYGNVVMGDNNRHTSEKGVTFGDNNENYKKYSYVFGKNNVCEENAFMVGQYGELREDYEEWWNKLTPMFSVGAGQFGRTNYGNVNVYNEDQNNYSNIFTIYEDGCIRNPLGYYHNDFRSVALFYNDVDNTMYGSFIRFNKGPGGSEIHRLEETPLRDDELHSLIERMPSFYITKTVRDVDRYKIYYHCEPVKFCRNITSIYTNFNYYTTDRSNPLTSTPKLFELYDLNSLNVNILSRLLRFLDIYEKL